MEVNHMKAAWMVTVAMVAVMEAQANPPRPRMDTQVTVYLYNRAGVPWNVLERAKRVAVTAFASAGIEIIWATGNRLSERPEAGDAENLTVAFDGWAPAHLPHAMGLTNIGRAADADVYIFHERIACQGTGFGQRLVPNLLGNVLAHELSHAIQGVARHSSKGHMKACWKSSDYIEMFRGQLPLAPEDMELLRAHFNKGVLQ
jgi:hypothetical protein